LDRLVRQQAAKGAFEFLSVSCESGGDTLESLTHNTSEFFDAIGAVRTAYADPQGVTRMSVAKRLGQPNIYYPTSMLIDTQGIVRGVWEGYHPTGVEEMNTMIDELRNAGIARPKNSVRSRP
jgi:hypothetical protein